MLLRNLIWYTVGGDSLETAMLKVEKNILLTLLTRFAGRGRQWAGRQLQEFFQVILKELDAVFTNGIRLRSVLDG